MTGVFFQARRLVFACAFMGCSWGVVLHGKAIVLSNEGLVVAYDPETGRITEFHAPEEENLMVTEDPAFARAGQGDRAYAFHGGERLWLTQQYLWRFITPNPAVPGQFNYLPDRSTDGEPWKVLMSSPRQLVVASRTSDWLGVTVERRLTLDAKKSVLSIETEVKKIKASPVPLLIWSISTIRHPGVFLLGINPVWREKREAWTELSLPGRLPKTSVTPGKNALVFRVPAHPDFPKVGTMGSWVAAVYDHRIFLQSVDFEPSGCYPESSAVQAFAAKTFSEIETLSPIRHLQPGESFKSRVTWKLLRSPSGAGGDLTSYLEGEAGASP